MKTLHSAALILLLLLSTATAQAPSPAPISALGPAAPGPSSGASDCLTPIANMTDCLSFVTEGSNSTAPDPNCCPEVAGLVESNPICLCQLLSNSSLTASFGITIDLAKALKLPSVCRLSTPPVSTCAAIGYPVPPVASEGPTAATSPSGAESPGSLASSPAGGNDKGAAFTIPISLPSILFTFAVSFLLYFY